MIHRNCVIRDSGRTAAFVCLAILWAAPGLARGQAVLLPGASELVTAQLPGSAGGMRAVERAPGDSLDHERSRSYYAVRLVPHVSERHGAPGLLLVYQGVAGPARFTDSALVLSRGLVPVWEVSHFGTRTVHFAYDGARVSVVRSSPDSGERRTVQTFPVPVFMWQTLDELVEALPLRAGYRAILPLYSEGDLNIEMDTVAVEGAGAGGQWTVRFADPVIVATFVVDGGTRRLLSSARTMRSTGGVVRRDPIPADQ